MFEVDTTLIVIGLLLFMVFAGIHVAVALGITAIVGLLLVTDGNFQRTSFFLGSTAYEALRAYVFAVVPLFMLMGEFVARSGAAADVYEGINRWLSRVPGRLAHATVLGNAVFAFVTGTSLASATAFTRIAYPQMKRFGYNRTFALGSIAGSACLGMLIPPSLFMVVWGILTEQSIGILFLAGVGPGFLLAGLMIVYIALVSIFKPELVGIDKGPAPQAVGADVTPAVVINEPEAETDDTIGSTGSETPRGRMISYVGIAAVVFGVLGGIWMGWYTPTEGAGIGAVIGLVLGIAKGLSTRQIYDAVLSVAKSAVPIMILLFAAQLYSRVLALAGVGTAVEQFFIGTGLGPWQILIVMIIIWFIMGMLIDSVSIMLLTVPIFAPLAVTIGFDPIVFALIGILAIEAGILTPPFGLLVYAVRAVCPDKDITMIQVFTGSTPYWFLLLIVMALCAAFPGIVTFLPDLIN
jgi:TRAP-type C4-dicarboxylate transport system permease large subunit